MKRLLLLLATLGCLHYSGNALVQGTIKSSAANSFKITIRNNDPATLTGNLAQYNVAVRVAQTVPQPTLALTNLLPVGTVAVGLTYTSGGYMYYNISFEAGTGNSNAVSLAQNVELDLFSGTFSNGAGSSQVDLVDTWMFTDATGTTNTGTGLSQLTRFYVNIDPSGPNNDATNYIARFYANGQSTTAINAPGTSFVGLNNVPLPVSYTYIKASNDGGSARISWGTGMETHNLGFDIERSYDGKTFSKIGFQASGAANGNTDAALEYSFTDSKPLEGVNYYRLKQVDRDGRFQYSKVVNVTFNGAGQTVKCYPNPATDRITVEGDGVKNILLYNVMGQVLTVPVTYGTFTHSVNTSGLAKGSYSLRIVTDNGMSTQKLIVQ